MNFLYYYLRSMRVYYCFITGTTTLLGLLAAHKTQGIPWGWRDAVILIIGFLAWGVNQIFSDWCDRKEDAVNAPHRAMVTGKLPAKPALLLSASLMAMFAIASGWISVWTLLPLAAGGIMNLCYSALKKIPVLNCLVYGSAISMCAAYGWIGAVGKLSQEHFIYEIPLLCLVVLPAHALMCHNSYFKDVTGDRSAGIRTMQTFMPEKITVTISGVLSVLYNVMIFMVVLQCGRSWASYLLFGWLLLLTGRLLLDLQKKCYHRATRSNCQLCAAEILGFTVCFSSTWLIAEGLVFLLIQLLFRWYPDEKE